MKTPIFKTNVISVGKEANDMLEGSNMLILFGSGAPQDLADFCFTIDNKKLTHSIKTGGKILIDDQEFPITAVGNVVDKNLMNLGHITISFDGSTEGSLPGTLHVMCKKLPKLNIGSTIEIFD